VRHLEETIARSTRYRALFDPAAQGMGVSDSKNNYLTSFDKKVMESDTYLQMIIDQAAKIEQRMSSMESGDEERAKYDELKVQTNVMLDHIKHSIVLLQIAKVCRMCKL
jgi:oxysterol-binding protein-related protein 9/10/11